MADTARAAALAAKQARVARLDAQLDAGTITHQTYCENYVHAVLDYERALTAIEEEERHDR